MNSLLIFCGKLLVWFSKTFNLGNGSTWPGHLALTVNKNFIRDILKKNQTYSSSESRLNREESRSIQNNSSRFASFLGGQTRTIKSLKIILVVGTNGKTTTSKLIRTILEKDGKRVIQNESGANLVNGVASTLLLHANVLGKIDADYAIFEIDENTLPLILKELMPNYVVVLNLFRDQLDRYGEVNAIAKKWDRALDSLPESSKILLNADDPQIAYFAKDFQAKVRYFGLSEKDAVKKGTYQAVDSTYCPNCGHKLKYKKIFFSHLGIWECESCQRKRPYVEIDSSKIYPLAGLYNKYNTHAAILLAKEEGISAQTIEEALKSFDAAFGRQEKIEVDGRHVQLFLTKNPTSFNESLRTVKELHGKYLLFVLNDRIPDGRDVSWIWDIDLESLLEKDQKIHVSGDRAYDMALRVKYCFPTVNHVDTHPEISKLLPDFVQEVPKNETLYILPTYSAMLEVRKLLTGRKIL